MEFERQQQLLLEIFMLSSKLKVSAQVCTHSLLWQSFGLVTWKSLQIFNIFEIHPQVLLQGKATQSVSQHSHSPSSNSSRNLSLYCLAFVASSVFHSFILAMMSPARQVQRMIGPFLCFWIVD